MKKPFAIEFRLAHSAPEWAQALGIGKDWKVCRRYGRARERDEALEALRKSNKRFGLWTFRRSS